MKRIDGGTYIEYIGVDWEKFPNLYKLLTKHNKYKRVYLNLYDSHRLCFYLLEDQKSSCPSITESGAYVGYDWLMNKVKEDDALLAEYAILRMQRG